MCLDLLGRVIARDGDSATVALAGRDVLTSTLLVPDLAVGEWVRVVAGIAVERLEAPAAAQINAAINKARGVNP